MDCPPGSPPAALAPLYGREHDLGRLLALLRGGVRLLTLRGPGGIGKTALARHLLDTLREGFDPPFDHLQFIDLSAVQGPEQVLGLIAASLPESGYTGEAARRIQTFVAGRRTLLLLDNFEQLLPAAPALGELLAATDTLRLVVTSRAALRLHAEVEYPVGPLALTHGAQGAASSAAVQLFVARVQAVAPAFTLDAGNTAPVARLCEVLEGVPLALELAAVRTRSLSLNDLLARLEHPLDVLRADFQDRPERLRSLRAAVQWSYDLLDDPDRAVFECCAVFDGPFSPQALEAVWGSPDVLDRAESLLAQSFLYRLDSPRTLWKMLQPLRELALEKLYGHTKEALWRERHALYFVERLEAPHADWGNPNTDRKASHLPHYPNVRAGMVWAVAQGRSDLAYRYLGAIMMMWVSNGFTVQEMPLADQVLALPPPADRRVLLRALRAGADCLGHSGRYAEQGDRLREALALCRELDDPGAATWVHLRLARLEYDAGRSAQALELQQGLLRHHLERLGDRRPTLNQQIWHAFALFDISLSLLGLGEYTLALEALQEARRRFQTVENARAEIHCRVFIAHTLLHLRRHSESGPLLLDCLQDASDGGARGVADDVLRWGLVFLAAEVHDWQGVAQFMAFCSGSFVGQSQNPLDVRGRHVLAQAREALGEVDSQEAWASGKLLRMPDIIERAEMLVQLACVPIPPAIHPELTPREREVLALVSQGHPDRRVARLLGIAPATASKHVGNLLGKLGLRNRVELARWAIEHAPPEGTTDPGLRSSQNVAGLTGTDPSPQGSGEEQGGRVRSSVRSELN